jgi:hypothetical protein
MPLLNAYISAAFTDQVAPLYFSDPSAWIDSLAPDKDRHIANATLYFDTMFICDFVPDRTNPPEQIKHAIALLAYADKDSPLFPNQAGIEVKGNVTSERNKVGPLEQEITYSSGAASHLADRLGQIKALLSNIPEFGYCIPKHTGGTVRLSRV